jgi:hypothetical protein
MSPKFWKQTQNIAECCRCMRPEDWCWFGLLLCSSWAVHGRGYCTIAGHAAGCSLYIDINYCVCYSLGTAWLELGAMRGCAAPLGFGLGHTMLEPRQQGSCHFWITARTYYNILEQDPILPERCRASKCSSSGQLPFALQRCAVQERDGKKVCGRMIYAHFPRFPDLDDAWHRVNIPWEERNCRLLLAHRQDPFVIHFFTTNPKLVWNKDDH